MDDVFLEGATPDGPAVVGHLSVIVDTEGITFLGPEPGERRTVGWDRMSPLEFGAPAAMPDGLAVTSLEFQLDGRPLRLLVPSQTGSSGGVAVEAPAPSAEVFTVEAPEFSGAIAGPVAPAPPPVFEPVIVPTPDPVAFATPEPVAFATPEPVAFATPEPVVAPTPEPVVAATPAPVAFASPAPVVIAPPTPAPVVIPEPVVIAPPTPAPVVIPEPVVIAPPAPTPVVIPEPVVILPPAPATSSQDVSSSEPELEEPVEDESEWTPAQSRAQYRPFSQASRKTTSPWHTRRTFRLVLLAVIAALIPLAVAVWSTQGQPSGGGGTTRSLSDTAVAGRVGIQPGDLPNWTSSAPRAGNAFAAGATANGPAGLNTAVQAATVMARCLHVPVSAVEGAFGMGSAISQRTAEVTSPSYADPSGNGGSVNSVVDVVKTPQIARANSNIFQDPSLFATCYQPYVQAMLPFAAGSGSGPGFATATVQPVLVPVPTGPADVEVAAFQIARIANDPGLTTTVVTTAIAVFGGRVQATIGTVSNFVFSIDAQNQLVHDVEVRTIGVSQL
jgi:hypothetical protein